MTLLKVQPDHTWAIVEERIRFPVDVSVPPTMVPFVVAKDLQKAIDILEKHRGWRRLETVPTHRSFTGKPCCTQLAGKPGDTITLKFVPSDFQGDTDDAHNFGEVSDARHRQEEEGLIDWVAIVHFWQPTITINTEQIREETPGPSEGFADWNSLPTDAWLAVRQRFERDRSE